jgi:NitT/TauT family transport system ATP-binding protein
MHEAYIQVRQARKVYETRHDSVEAVGGISFDVNKGEFVAILGPSGCGKSTLLMMCAGLESLTSGSIIIDDEPVTVPRINIGVMFQEATLMPWRSVVDNVLFPIQILKRSRAVYAKRAAELIEMVGLQGFEKKRPHQLSGGMRQRAAICRALVYDPDILLMDEPFSALDAITRDEMNTVLLDIWQRYNKTALFVTHSIREAVLLADRVLVMTQRPSRIAEDVKIPFARPRDPSITETEEFNRLCNYLHGLIDGRGARRPHMAALPA